LAERVTRGLHTKFLGWVNECNREAIQALGVAAKCAADYTKRGEAGGKNKKK